VNDRLDAADCGERVSRIREIGLNVLRLARERPLEDSAGQVRGAYLVTGREQRRDGGRADLALRSGDENADDGSPGRGG